jgi:hypothetical protein
VRPPLVSVIISVPGAAPSRPIVVVRAIQPAAAARDAAVPDRRQVRAFRVEGLRVD